MNKQLFTFCVKIVVLVLLVIFSVTAILILPLAYGHPLSSIVNHKKIAQKESQKSGRKAFFLSGSSAWVGIDGNQLKVKNKVQLINMGFYAGFDITYQFYLIKKYLKAGDIVICSPEYGVIFDKRNNDSEARKWMLISAPGYALRNCYKLPGDIDKVYLDIGQLCLWKIVGVIRGIAEGHLNGLLSGGYVKFYKKANEYGTSIDEEFPKLSYPDVVKDSLNAIKYGTELCGLLDSIGNIAESMHVKFYFFPPPYPVEEYEKNEIKIDSFYTQLKTLKKVQLLGEPVLYLFNNDYFTNSVNHIDARGRDKRTSMICDALSRDTN